MNWVEACAADALRPNLGLSVKLGTERVGLFFVAGRVFALRDLCPHQGALLSEGGAYEQKDGPPIVVCPVHYWTFSLEDGKSPHRPSMCAETFPAEIRGDKVWVGLPSGQVPADANV